MTSIPPELELMLVEAYVHGFVHGGGSYPPDLDDEAVKAVRMLPVLGRIGGVEIRRIRIRASKRKPQTPPEHT